MAREASTNAVNLFCEGTTIVGDMHTKDDIRVDGAIKGNIVTDGRLVIGHTAKIEGNIECMNIDVQGVVVGDIRANGTVTLKSSAKMTGNIVTGTIVMEAGALFNGSCQMQQKTSSKE